MICPSREAHLISELMKKKKAWKLVISYDEDNASRLYEDIGCAFWAGLSVSCKGSFIFDDLKDPQITAKRVEVWKHLER